MSGRLEVGEMADWQGPDPVKGDPDKAGFNLIFA